MNPLCAKIIHSFITKYGTPLAPVTKHSTPYVPRSYPHSLRNMEHLLPLLLNMECLIWQGSYSHSLQNMEPLLLLLLNIEPLMLQNYTLIHYKYVTLLAPVTKYWRPYVPISYTHSLQNMEPLILKTKIVNPYLQTVTTKDNNWK